MPKKNTIHASLANAPHFLRNLGRGPWRRRHPGKSRSLTRSKRATLVILSPPRCDCSPSNCHSTPHRRFSPPLSFWSTELRRTLYTNRQLTISKVSPSWTMRGLRHRVVWPYQLNLACSCELCEGSFPGSSAKGVVSVCAAPPNREEGGTVSQNHEQNDLPCKPTVPVHLYPIAHLPDPSRSHSCLLYRTCCSSRVQELLPFIATQVWRYSRSLSGARQTKVHLRYLTGCRRRVGTD
ncbi:hypothetical protein GQ53DRAFT_156443 [Thozetella sp. PMI_491]|nr:hypothetical protein GQ53DRAFT_156443 [Thozetella sp. PMI_491]